MLKSVWATVRNGKIELLEDIQLSEGTKVLITLISDQDEQQFWLTTSEKSLNKVWDNQEDEIYAELLKK
ncbi:hypothetical protein IQ247_17515 [Plectonema cf. radiosum LEGE 06105]|uniref:Uncharacterized protein n=1 Tax=Plectonema cf. radiosum LEGE 06105 TaxID=945769 RepID=A0A8J7F5V7_9CYAN|nr:hypothetical protein [Plectonema radiosum]MBE9214445.1 hypothetical protein [Plectonema cf. radiosum LEGE 06105]MBF2015942.1 hypothetical protein [Rivularia sp. T60_A2020_040]